jgi:hypothetical protein
MYVHVYRVLRTPWPESTSELYRRSDRRLSAKLMPTFVDIEYHVVSVTDACCRILDFYTEAATFSTMLL